VHLLLLLVLLVHRWWQPQVSLNLLWLHLVQKGLQLSRLHLGQHWMCCCYY
jgi:hypothetical protein